MLKYFTKATLIVLALVQFNFLFGQETEKEDEKKDYGRFYGGIESNMQYYIKDEGLESAIVPDDPFRSNNYLYANYNYKRWTAGLQVESYEPNALLNYNPQFEGTNLGIFYVNYKDEKWNVTLGHF